MRFEDKILSRLDIIDLNPLGLAGYSLALKREDLIHPQVSGNKWRKLKYHVLAAEGSQRIGLLTFGGAFSNHIAATAAASAARDLKSIGVIRGERIEPLNPTLAAAEANGMELCFVSRVRYRSDKTILAREVDPEGRYHHVPEGGADELGVRGCEEILSAKEKERFDVIACSCGTGGTAAGLLRSGEATSVWVYPALKGGFSEDDILKLAGTEQKQAELVMRDKYHFGGYAKTSMELLSFVQDFYRQYGIKLDPVYTAKLMYGVLEDMRAGVIRKDQQVLVIHTGGVQGAAGIALREELELYPDT